MKHLAIDSVPLAQNLITSTDYSGLQLYGLQHLSLRECLESVQSLDSQTRLRVVLKAHGDRNANASTLAKGFIEGLGQMIQHSSLLRKILGPNVQSARTTKDGFEMMTKRPCPLLLELVNSPTWIRCQDGSPLPVKSLVQRSHDQWEVHGASGSPEYQVHLVNSPEENHKKMNMGSLDFACDTAIDLANLPATASLKHTGLWAGLYPALTSENKRSAVFADLADLDFGMCFSRLPRLRYENAQLPKTAERGNISLGYDNFYPNSDICTHIAHHLEAKGWNVALKEDNYYQPQLHSTDLKFLIKRPLTNSPLMHAYSMLGFAQTAEQFDNWMSYIKKIECDDTPPAWEQLCTELHMAIPLFKLPSIHWAQVPGALNPLTRNLY